MAKYYLRIITDSCTQAAEYTLNQFLHSLGAISKLHDEALKPYWKNPGQGELTCQLVSDKSSEEIRAVLADKWAHDVADANWSHIHAPHAVFIWVSADHETNL